MRKVSLWGVIIGMIGLFLSALPQTAGSVSDRVAETITYDVACDGASFVLNKVFASANSIRRGDTFVLTGKIYPGNMIPDGGTKSAPSSFGPNSAGSIGTWIARGVFLANGKEFDSEKIQRATTHYFLLNDKTRLFTEGFEGTVEVNRIILGGLGNYEGAAGIVKMNRIGVNPTKAYNLRFAFDIK